jgi:hypothetical protein
VQQLRVWGSCGCLHQQAVTVQQLQGLLLTDNIPTFCCCAGMGISWLMQWWKNRPLRVFEAAQVEAAEGRLHTESAAVMKKVYRSVRVSLLVAGLHPWSDS